MAEPWIAISGLGSIGRQHLRALREAGAGPIVGYDASAEMRTAAAGLDGELRLAGTFEELLDHEPVAVIVAVPDRDHLDQLARAARTGAAVLVEKPLGPSAAEARKAVAELGPAGERSLVGYVLRHRTVVRRVGALLAEGAIGEPTGFQVLLGAYGTITAAANRFAQPEPDRLFRDYSHEWDYLAWFFGPVARVLAVARTSRLVPHVEQPNLVDALLELESGLVGALHVDYVDRRGLRQLSVIGTDGSLTADLGAGTITVRRTGAVDDQLDHAEPAQAALRRQAEHLLAVARGEQAPAVTLADGIAALSVADALRTSAADRSWVDCDS
ncbi:Gfo/Idh/MocA family protein [Microlunatus sp. GCM10028923]|uniref:Gfo/Idh/MocA family protein n=1 Tax=Microlunatus sp. GCM10028923 TaxID=3273400 RepID=UPI0036188455